jgi:hypothetical protein
MQELRKKQRYTCEWMLKLGDIVKILNFTS